MLGKVLIVIGVLVLLAIIIGSVIIGGYNRVIALEESVKSSWGQVENQLQRRYDLIPNLVQTVKGYAAHEKEIFSNIAEARTQYFQAKDVPDKARAASQLEGALSRLLFLQERYPDLKANENFLKLQDQLEGTENRIAVERKRYNDAVRDLNTYVRSFPGRFYASIAGVKQGEYFEAPREATTAPTVDFSRIESKTNHLAA
ncbi:MAG: LemA family protein [Phycisphaerae bacterium]|nr:LemA family protein [Phycisphaerae bacterium]